MSGPEVWEHGSEFHLPDSWEQGSARGPWDGRAAFYGSGRDALRALLAHGRETRGWRRLWVPSYFCREVVEAALASGVAVEAYSDNPLEAGPEWGPIAVRRADVVLRVNFLGLRYLGPADEIRRDGVEVIDDHTHDPWSESAFSGVADWCFASLRKTLPLPDGGVLWSPAGHDPMAAAQVTPEHRAASLEKLGAMALKGIYLRGGRIDKEVFRELALAGEARLGGGPVSGMTPWARELMRTFPTEAWRRRRRENYDVLATTLEGLRGATVLKARENRSCPFCVGIVLDSAERRKVVRERLIAGRVYPAVLWPMEAPGTPGVRACDVDLSRRMLALHCDMRYDAGDMQRVAALVREAARAEGER
jgi:hypothetical protein